MSNPRYAFLKLDAPIMPVIRIGKPERTAEDVLLACRDLPRDRFLFALYAWAYFEEPLPELIRMALVASTDIEEVRNLHARLKKQDRKDAIQTVIKATLLEHRQADICKTCNGQGEKIIENKNIICAKCKGRGRVTSVNNTIRAERIGRHERSYERTWKKLYESIYSMFSGWGDEVIAHMRKNGY